MLALFLVIVGIKMGPFFLDDGPTQDSNDDRPDRKRFPEEVPQNRLNRRLAFCPPKAKLLFNAYSMSLEMDRCGV